MNGENNHVFHTSALDGAEPGHDPRAGRWIPFAQLAMLAAFIGMSLVAIAVVSSLSGAGPYGVAVPGVGGALLTVLAARGLARVIEGAERDTRQRGPAKVRTSPAAAQARIAGMTPTL